MSYGHSFDDCCIRAVDFFIKEPMAKSFWDRKEEVPYAIRRDGVILEPISRPRL